MDVTIVGPVYDTSGYAYHTRTQAIWLRRLGVRVSLRAFPWGSARVSLDPETQAEIAAMLREPEGRGPVVYITVANAFKKDPGRPSIGYTMLETDRIPPFWVDLCNGMDEVWVPTEFNRHTFIDSGVDPAKVAVIPLGCKPDVFHPRVPPLRLLGRKGFAFLSNFEWIPRKGYDVLLRAYAEEFSGADDVCLILKTYNNSAYDPEGASIRNELIRLVEGTGNPNPPAVILISRVIPPERLPSLYTAADCYVLPTRGEGWNHPALEAAACGLPVIVTAWSSHPELFNEWNSYLIPIRGLEPVPAYGIPNDQVYAGSQWAVPSVEDTRRLMRHVYIHRMEARAKGHRARDEVARVHTWESSARKMFERLSRWGDGMAVEIVSQRPGAGGTA